MQCTQIIKRLSAWADHELTGEEKKELEQHLTVCADCRAMAGAYEKLALAMVDLGPVYAPHGFSRKVRNAARADMKSEDMVQWWQHLSLAWRGMVCTMAMAGLLFGAVLGTNLPTDADDVDGTGVLMYLSISDDGGYY